MAEKIVEVDGKRYMKVQKGKYFDKKKNRKMKRHHPVRWILISAFCLLIVAPVGFVFGAFYDPTTKNVADTPEKFIEYFTNTISKSLAGMSEGKLTLELDNNFLDSTLVVAQDQLLSDPTISQYIKKLYCNIDGNTYDFILDVQFAFFKTRVHLQTELNEPQSETDSYIFKIKNVIVGRLPLGGLAKTFLPKFIDEKSIQTAIQSIFPNCKFSLSDMQITYARTDLKGDLYKILNGIDLDFLGSPLSSVLLSLYDSIDSKATFKDKICIEMNFNNEKIVKPKIVSRNPIDDDSSEKKFKKYLSDYSIEVTKLLNDKIITKSESGTIFKYFVTGISDEAKAIFEKKSSVAEACKAYLGIEDVTKYYGNKIYLGKKLSKDDMVKEIEVAPTIDLTELAKGIDLCKVKESTLSKYIRSTPLMGYTFDMPIEIDGEYNFAYVMFDDFSVNIEENIMNILGDINLNGFSLPLTITTKAEVITGTNRKLEIVPQDIYIGTIPLPNDVKPVLLDYIKSGFTGGDIFTFDGQKFEINISSINIPTGTYSEIINNILQAKAITVGGTTIQPSEYTFKCSSKYDDTTKGYLNLFVQYPQA